MKKVIIIGAGPAGLTAGYELSKLGVQVEMIEASDRVGGMAASFELWGQRVDLGPIGTLALTIELIRFGKRSSKASMNR